MTTIYYTLHRITIIISDMSKLFDIITKLPLYSDSFASNVKIKKKKNGKKKKIRKRVRLELMMKLILYGILWT
jgi:hypothetical protein